MEKREKITILSCVSCGAHGKLIRPNKKIPARPNTHTSLPHHKTLPPLLPPAAASLPLLPPPSPSPSSPLRRRHRHPSLLYAPSRHPASTGGTALGSHSGAGRGAACRHSPARAGAATVSQPRRGRDRRQRRSPVQAGGATTAHHDPSASGAGGAS